LVPIYEGKNVLVVKDAAELVGMIRRAKGRDGTGAEYVRSVAHELVKRTSMIQSSRNRRSISPAR
jgi:hypothetical protein